MLLKDKIKKILIDNKLSLNEFYEKTGLSRTFYYAIRDGKTTSLLSTTAIKITDAFPEVDYEWLVDNQEERHIPLNTSKPSIEDIIAEKVLGKTLPELLEIKELLHKLLDTLNATTLKQSESIKNNEDTIKETFKQLLSLQNSFISEKNNRNENNKSG